MKIIYIHGLDSSSHSIKGKLLEEYCSKHCPKLDVIRPDLNHSPDIVFKMLCDMITMHELQGETTSLVGSSLGGYFATLVSNRTGCAAVLLNPSTQPHVSLQRFVTHFQQNKHKVIYETSGGWQITASDLKWFSSNILSAVTVPNKLYAIIKAGDELLDPKISKQFYESFNVNVEWQQGGDHRMSDFSNQIPRVIQYLQTLNDIN